MSLKEYNRKRSFDKTPEPPPREHSTPPGNYFCVQRHDATRLHYDFRLEVDGTLKSWAVPKGPSLEPLAKHLAMHVEDHPIDYGGFEGNIPKGEYGGGSVMLWDRGSYELLGDAPALAQIERGDFKFRLHGEKLRGEFALVLMRGRGKGNEWLLIKKKDADAQPGWNIEDHARSVLTGRTQQEIAENLAPSHSPTPNPQPHAMPSGAVKAPMPRTVSPMLATLATRPPSGDSWLYEVKWDGVRALCFIDRWRTPHSLALRETLRSAVSRAQRAAAPRESIAGYLGRRDRGAGRQRPLQLQSDPAAHFGWRRQRGGASFPLRAGQLVFIRSAVSGWLRSARRAARRPQAPAFRNCHAFRAYPCFRFLHRGWRCDARSRARQRAGRYRGQGARKQIRRTTQPRMDQSENRHVGRFRHRRIHARRARLLQLAGAGALRRRKADACRASGHGIQREVAQGNLYETRAADHQEKSVHRNSRRRCAMSLGCSPNWWPRSSIWK